MLGQIDLSIPEMRRSLSLAEMAAERPRTPCFISKHGRIELNGVPLNESSLPHYKQYFSAAFADFHLFDEVDCGHQDTVVEQATDYLLTLQIDDEVQLKSGRFSPAACR